jgi:hypothetical protein
MREIAWITAAGVFKANPSAILAIQLEDLQAAKSTLT